MNKPHPCPKCGFLSSSDIECVKCGIIFDKYNNLGIHQVESQQLLKAEAIDVEEIRDTESVSIFASPKANMWALPISLVTGYIFQKLWVTRYLVILFCVIPLHEMGHAIAAWMTGHFAVPLGAIVPTAGLTLIGQERHMWVYLIFFSLFGYLGFKAWVSKLYYLVIISGLYITASVYLSYSLSDAQMSTFFFYGGIAGEFILSTILILSFYQPSFKKLRWDFFRYPFLLMGSMAFVNSVDMWLRIQSKLSSIPFGTAISSDGAADANGDMNRLVASGWSQDQIISRYLMLAKIGFWLILIQYIYILITSYGKKNEDE